MMMRRYVFALLLLAAMGLAGCSEEEDFSQPDNPPGQGGVTSNIVPEPTPIETAQVEQDFFTYDPAGRRNPFKPLIESTAPSERVIVAAPRPSICEPPGPLQEYETRQYKLVGIVAGQGGNYAMVESPDGKTYNFRAGTCIGKGIVQAITLDRVIVKETILYRGGEKEEIEIVLSLSPEEAGVVQQ